MKIRKDDQVIVISGKDKGKEGRVLEVLRDRNKVIVENIASATKHSKVRQSNRGTKEGGIETIDMPIDISNVMLIDSKSNPTRVSYRVEKQNRNGKLKNNKVRVSKVTGEDF
jgi:large subunit ribosomal protein L24